MTRYRTLEIPIDADYLEYHMKKHHLDEKTLIDQLAQACHRELWGFEDDDLGHVLFIRVSPQQYLALQEWEGTSILAEKNTHEHAIETVGTLIKRAINKEGL